MTSNPSLPNYPSGKNLLEGKSVLITAAAGTGIGFACAKRCSEEGATLIISDIHEKRLNAAADTIERESGKRPVTVLCDVTQETQVQHLFERAEQATGGIDILINNAGLGGTSNLIDMSDDQWNAVLNVTLTGTMRCTRAALKHMQTRSGGVIVNNASVIGWRAQKGQSHYAAAKAGVMALTRCAALEAAPFNIRINAVAPSLAMHPHLSKVTTDELLATLTEQEAFGRAAEPWEIANVIIFLASEYSSYMTGEIVSVSSQRA